MLLKEKRKQAKTKSDWRKKWELRMLWFTIAFVTGLTIWSMIVAPIPTH